MNLSNYLALFSAGLTASAFAEIETSHFIEEGLLGKITEETRTR